MIPAPDPLLAAAVEGAIVTLERARAEFDTPLEELATENPALAAALASIEGALDKLRRGSAL